MKTTRTVSRSCLDVKGSGFAAWWMMAAVLLLSSAAPMPALGANDCFDDDSSTMTLAGDQVLRPALGAARALLPGSRMQLVAVADPLESLTLARAESIRDHLVAGGVAPERLSIRLPSLVPSMGKDHAPPLLHACGFAFVPMGEVGTGTQTLVREEASAGHQKEEAPRHLARIESTTGRALREMPSNLYFVDTIQLSLQLVGLKGSQLPAGAAQVVLTGLQTQLAALERHYRAYLAEAPELTGWTQVRLSVEPDGRVHGVVVQLPVEHTEFQEDLETMVQSWSLPDSRATHTRTLDLRIEVQASIRTTLSALQPSLRPHPL